MKTTKLSALLTILLSLVTVNTFAYDIAVENKDGVTIYYNYNNDGTELIVTYETETTSTNRTHYSNTVVIPSEVTFMNRTRRVTSIGDHAFSNCKNLTSVTIPNSITSIGTSAFSGCKKLTSITIPNSVTSIETSAFSSCSGLSSISIGNSVTSIGHYAFAYCNSLTSLIIPNSVTSIGQYAIAFCNGLTSLVIGDGLMSMGGSMCYQCPNLINVTLGNSLKRIEFAAFSDCSSLKYINIPNSVSEIGQSAFRDCTQLTYIIIPNSVTSIELRAFEGCNLSTVISLIENPFKIKEKKDNSRTFSINTFNNATLYVPKGTIEKYKATTGWKDFVYISDRQVCKLTYMLDGEEYKSYFVDCDSIIAPEKEPTGDTLFNNPLVTDAKQFSSPYSENDYGKIDGGNLIDGVLIDGDPTTYWHSYWKGGEVEGGTHYLQVKMPENIDYETLVFRFSRRSNAENDHTTEWSVRGTNDFDAPKPDCEELLYEYTPFTSKDETLISTPFYHKGYKYLRFYSEKQEGTKYGTRGFFHLGEFNLYSVTLPEKEGYSFAGWFLENGDTIPEKMPDHELTVYAKYVPNTYQLIYMVGDDVYKIVTYKYGETITPESQPEGYYSSFEWIGVPETMPAHDVTVTSTFTISKYKLTYKVDDVDYKSLEIEYGSEITPEAAPAKEGYSFSGWSEIPETMPAHDVTITGTFTVNQYKLVYKVDDADYMTYELDYGVNITPEAAPAKEGYTFSGWSEIPETMPAHDVTVTGSFTVNQYKLVYKVDDADYMTYELDYGVNITPEEAPTKEGYTFSGWSEIPETMPAHDVTVIGSFTINSYKLTYMIDDKVYKETIYEYGATITPEPQPEGDYATFEWIDLPQTMPAHDVVVYAKFTTAVMDMSMKSDQDAQFYYSIGGQRIAQPRRGVTIVRSKNGAAKKVVVK